LFYKEREAFIKGRLNEIKENAKCMSFSSISLTVEEEFYNLYSSPNVIRQIKSRRMRLAGHVARTEVETKMYKVVVGKSDGKRPFGRPRRRWDDGIKMDLREINWGWNGLRWLRIGTSRRSVMNPWVLAPRT
jgi:hypothetical protein